MTNLNVPWTVKLIITPGVEPTLAQLNLGDICLNIADGRFFFRLTSDQITELVSADYIAAQFLTQASGDQRYQLLGSAGGLKVTPLAENQTLTPGRLHVCGGGVRLILTLPVGATGDRLQVVAAAAQFRIAQPPGVQCAVGELSTTFGETGRIDSATLSDALELVCLSPGVWRAFMLNGYFEVV